MQKLPLLQIHKLADTQQDIEKLTQIISERGPITIALYVNSNFQRYSGGIFDDDTCPQKERL